MDQSKENSKMKSFKTSLTEATKSQVVVSFGRMNPMTNGHEKLADKIKTEAKKRNADAKLYLSHSTNPKKDPLDFKTKVKFAKKAFGPMVQNSVARTIIEVAKELSGKYDDLIVVVGSDRIPEFKTLLNKYNGKDYTFKTIEIVSAGERDPDAEGVSGMSGSKMRGFVTSDDFDSFKQGVPSKLSDSDAKALFDAVKRGMNLKEELEQQDEAVLSYSARRMRAQKFKRMSKRLQRARALQMKRFADPKRLKQRAVKMAYKFFRTRLAGGKNYADLSTGEKIAVDTRLQKTLPAIRKFAIRLVPAARSKEIMRKQSSMMKKESIDDMFENFIVEKPTVPQDRDVKDREGTQPKKYYAGVSKDDKDARAAHFERNTPKSDSDKSAYADAPGDKEAREKGDMQQSKHTKKFKQMYGEAVKTPEDRKEISRLDQLVRLGLADTKSLTVIKRSVEKLKSGDMLNPAERNVTNDLLTTLLDMVTSNDSLFRMTRSQLQKESYLKCNYTTEGTMCEQHGMKDCSMSEAAYKGNIGMMEMMKFFEVASKEQKEKLKKLIADKNQSAAWKLIQDVTGMKLMGEEYDDSVEMDGISMAQIELSSLADDVEDVLDMLEEMEEEPEQWVLSKITKATDYISSVRDYLEFEGVTDDEEMPDDGEYDDGEDYDDDELDAELMNMNPSDFGDAYEEFRPILEEIEGLKKKAEKSGIPYGILKAVYNRGMAAWKTGHRPGTTAQQWAFARVNSFITKGPGTWGDADKDLASKVRSNEEFTKFAEALEWGTDAMRKKYASDTPGQSTDIQSADHQTCCDDCKDEMTEDVDWENVLAEADYQGKSVKLNDPFRTPDGPKKFGVYTMGPNGNVVVVRFGDPNMEIKRDDPARRASFRARHGCDDDPGPKYKAKYWSCYQWRSGAKVDS
jgi:nicotinic acid mononucleotide adenylyltransferase